MPGNPKKHLVVEALAQLAVEEMGEGATALDYVAEHIEDGGRVSELRKLVGEAIGGDVSSGFFSRVINRLEPDAKQRLDAARKASAPALVERARDIVADAPTGDRVKWERAKEEAALNKWLAERYAKDTYGTQQPATNLNVFNVGAAHLSAFQHLNAQRALTATATIEATAVVVEQPPALLPSEDLKPADGQ